MFLSKAVTRYLFGYEQYKEIGGTYTSYDENT